MTIYYMLLQLEEFLIGKMANILHKYLKIILTTDPFYCQRSQPRRVPPPLNPQLHPDAEEVQQLPH